MKTDRISVLGAYIDHLSWDEVLGKIREWAHRHESRYVCICNVHSVVTATRDAEFEMVINHADLATPDGAPVAWAMRHSGLTDQQRINGPDLMWRYLNQAQENGQRPFFYGSSEETLKKMIARIQEQFPLLTVAGMHSPPFRALTQEENEAEIDLINQSGAHVVFVGLGCPKQERWMAAHCGRIHAVMVGVGAAFDYHAGTLRRAPLSWQTHGFEWLYRLLSEPRRLFLRYLKTNTLFILGLSRQLLLQRTRSK